MFSSGPLDLSSSTPPPPIINEAEENKKRFRLNNGKIVYQEIRHEGKRHQSDNDWYGCSFCNRWFQSLCKLEQHYSREHEGADSYKFELLELKNCVIELPSILPSAQQSRIVSQQNATATIPTTPDDLNLHLSALSLSAEPAGDLKLSMRKSIRQAIKDTQVDGNGSSYKKIKAYLVNKTGMSAEKLNKKLRKVLERSVELKKLERRFSKGKTLYSLSSHKRPKGDKMPKEETRRFRDQQLKIIAKSLKPHGLLPHK